MAEVIGVRFKEVGKVYYFDPLDNKLSVGDRVIVETARGLECGEVAVSNKSVSDEEVKQPLKPLIRIATEKDLNHVAENHLREKEAYKICEKKIAAHKLEMKLVNVEYTFDNSKIIFYFTADGRVDFRALVKDLAGVFRTRIELRQIGVRDEAKMLGGLGVCGRPFCCTRFMGDFQPVSIKMAKEQGLSLSPVKISGTCGRLMCCLKYEQEAYTDLLRHTPKVGAIVKTPDGKGLVVETNLIARTLKVKLDNTPEDVAPKAFKVKECKLIKDGYIKVNRKEIEQLGNLEKE
ncbi:MAG: stage 0 sporulation family protein [Ruminococcus sp.]|nr:stage 0 sporulation family protein [Ruminococcus sp.]